MHGAGSERLKLLGRKKLKVHVGPDTYFIAHFLVAENLMTDMIWGDYLLGVDQLNVILDFARAVMYSRALDFDIPLRLVREQPRLPTRGRERAKPAVNMSSEQGTIGTAASNVVRSLSSLTMDEEMSGESDSELTEKIEAEAEEFEALTAYGE